MNIEDIKNFSKKINGKCFFNYEIKNLNWFNIGGKTKIFFKPNSLKELLDFLKLYNKRGKIFILGAGSNVLFSDELYEGVIIKLSSKFNNLSLLDNNTIIAGSGVLDKSISDFAQENGIGGFEFLSCIPGTIGGGIRMNSGCFGNEFKDILISVQAIDYHGNIRAIPSKDINFFYRGSSLESELIFLSGTFRGQLMDKLKIKNQVENLKEKKNIAQPTKIKTGGSTFKNPVNQTNKKIWEIIKECVPLDTKFGDASISSKHCNFFINENKAKSEDMKKLINYVKKQIKKKTNLIVELEVVIVE